MQNSGIPTKFPIPWANSAGGGYVRAIPVASQVGIMNGAASLADGFPPSTFLPISSGGSWPFGQDFNGIVKQITQWLQWIQAGGPVAYDSAFQTAIGGYPNGAVVASAVTAGLSWRSTADNNTTNPDTGGAGWVLAAPGRLLNVQVFTTPGTATYTPTAGTASIEVTVLGGGGGGGGTQATSAGYFAVGAPGSAGALSIGRIASGFAGATVTVGAAGAAGAAGNNAGGGGGTSSFGAVISALGGAGGNGGAQTNTGTQPVCAPGSIGSGGSILNVAGAAGSVGLASPTTSLLWSGAGGSSPYGAGAPNQAGVGAGLAGQGFGSGGGPAHASASQAAFAGGAGTGGLVIVQEYS